MTRSHFGWMGALLAPLALAATVHALPPPNLSGTDTMNDIIVSLIANCTGVNAANIVFVGGGSGIAGDAMVNQLAPQPATGRPYEQISAPQSRRLSMLDPTNPNYHCTSFGGSCTSLDTTECGRAFAKQPGTLSTAEGIVVGLDGVDIVTNSDNSEFCGGATAIDPTVDSIRDLVVNPEAAYPLSRKLYYNSLIGFSDPLFTSGTDFEKEQGKLAACILSGDSVLNSAVTGAGFVAMPAGPVVEPMCP